MQGSSARESETTFEVTREVTFEVTSEVTLELTFEATFESAEYQIFLCASAVLKGRHMSNVYNAVWSTCAPTTQILLQH
jgi:hypothetical protein